MWSTAQHDNSILKKKKTKRICYILVILCYIVLYGIIVDHVVVLCYVMLYYIIICLICFIRSSLHPLDFLWRVGGKLTILSLSQKKSIFEWK